MSIIRHIRLALVLLSIVIGGLQSHALFLSLDSVAAMGKFPKFCVDVYRWGDGFFNGYDTTYVVGTGYKFNAKCRMESWIDAYQFYLPENVRMHMKSEPTTTAGFYLTYLAVTGGYAKNISHFFGSPASNAREEFSFGFNCSLFAFNMRFVNNTGGVNIKRFSRPGTSIKPDLPFDGLKSKYFGFDTYYFFNHKRYSQAAAFSFSRIQVRSQGSWFAGISFYNQRFNFDFNSLPQYIIDTLPDKWIGHRYEADTKNLGVKFGYGYNWVFAPNWLLGVYESPTIGFKRGIINNPDKKKTSLTFSNLLRLSILWNHRQWFAGMVGEVDAMLLHDSGGTIQNSLVSGNICVGYRFNIW